MWYDKKLNLNEDDMSFFKKRVKYFTEAEMKKYYEKNIEGKWKRYTPKSDTDLKQGLADGKIRERESVDYDATNKAYQKAKGVDPTKTPKSMRDAFRNLEPPKGSVPTDKEPVKVDGKPIPHDQDKKADKKEVPSFLQKTPDAPPGKASSVDFDAERYADKIAEITGVATDGKTWFKYRDEYLKANREGKLNQLENHYKKIRKSKKYTNFIGVDEDDE